VSRGSGRYSETMAHDGSSKSLSAHALDVLSELPPRVHAFPAEGGTVDLIIEGQEGQDIIAQAPRHLVNVGLHLTLRTADHEIALAVAEIQPAGDRLVHVRLEVRDVRHRQTERVSPRAWVKELALIHVLAASAIDPGEEFDVRLADLSQDGMAFITERRFAPGDTLTTMVSVDVGLIRLGARVLQVTAAHYGRLRVGCEVTRISDADRELIARLAEQLPAPGTTDQRLKRAG